MRHGRNFLILISTVIRVLWLVAAALCVVGGRWLRQQLAARCPLVRWQAGIPC